MNPYKILNINPGAEKKDVMKAVAISMRERKFSAKKIAIAQKTILNPLKRSESLFNEIDFTSVLAELHVRMPVEYSLDCLKEPISFS